MDDGTIALVRELQAEVARLTAENARLRDALKQIANDAEWFDVRDMGRLAQRALDGERNGRAQQ